MDTSTGLLSHTFAWLSEHPEENQRLLHEPELLKRATEEFLRWVSRHQHWRGPSQLKPNSAGSGCARGPIALSWASANQDAEIFDDPDTINLDRWPNRHQAFGLGAHRCLGSNLGRVQFQEVLKVTLRRLPDLKVDLAGAQRYPSLGQVNGYATLPATFTPSAPVGADFPPDDMPVA